MMKDRARTLFYSYMGVLLFLFVLKILGVKNLELMCENEVVINICNFIDNTFMEDVVAFLMYLFTTTLIIQSIFSVKKFIGKQNLFYLFISIGEIIRLIFFDIAIVTVLIDFILLIVIPFVYNKKLILKSIVVAFIVFMFQLISFFVKEISIYEHTIDNTLTAVIYSLDYIIMLFLLRDFFIDLIFRKESKQNG